MNAGQKNRPKRNRECYLCGHPATTNDHIPPKCIYPEPKPSNLITVPACVSCNSATKLDDEYFRWLVATGSPGSQEARALVKGPIVRGFRKRPALLYSVMKYADRLSVSTPAGIFVGTQPVFQFDRPRVQVVINKIVRGLYHYNLQRTFPPDYIVADFRLNPRLTPEFQTEICKLPLRDVGDGSVFSYRFIESEDEVGVTLWFLMFFNRVLFITQTEPNPQFPKTTRTSRTSEPASPSRTKLP